MPPSPRTVEHYERLKRYVVADVFFDEFPDTGEPVASLLLRSPGRTDLVALVMCDPEGNGPGHLDIVEI